MYSLSLNADVLSMSVFFEDVVVGCFSCACSQGPNIVSESIETSANRIDIRIMSSLRVFKALRGATCLQVFRQQDSLSVCCNPRLQLASKSSLAYQNQAAADEGEICSEPARVVYTFWGRQ